MGRIVGIVTPADFVRHDAMQPAAQASGRISQIMTRKVRVARIDRHLVELIPLFGGSGHHHMPVVDADGRLVGDHHADRRGRGPGPRRRRRIHARSARGMSRSRRRPAAGAGACVAT